MSYASKMSSGDRRPSTSTNLDNLIINYLVVPLTEAISN
jgi:hypothetical protein